MFLPRDIWAVLRHNLSPDMYGEFTPGIFGSTPITPNVVQYDVPELP